MGRTAGSWLEGPGLPRDQPPGVRLGLPATGPGSVAGFGPRAVAYIVDAIVANLLVGIPYVFGVHYAGTSRGLYVFAAFLLEELVLVTVAGQTIGMMLVRLRVIRVSDGRLQSFPWVLVRTVLLALFVPALIWDRDRRGLHDKTAGTVVIHDPNGPAEDPTRKISMPRPGQARRERAAAAAAGQGKAGGKTGTGGKAGGARGAAGKPGAKPRPGVKPTGAKGAGPAGSAPGGAAGKAGSNGSRTNGSTPSDRRRGR